MNRNKRKYKRLPGRPFSLFVVRSLWQGPDHLLWVESVYFKEHYKRFHYDDIQAVIMQRTDTHMLWTVCWVVLAAISGLIAYLVPGTPYISGALTVVFLLVLLINLILGASCTVFLQTAAQVQRITSLKRVRTAFKTLGRIKALVEARQGKWEITEGLPSHTAVQAAPAARPMTGSRISDPGQNAAETTGQSPFTPFLHQVLFALLLIIGALGAIQMQIRNLPVAILETLLHGATQILVMVTLVRWHRHLKGTLILKLNWLALVFIGMETIIGYGLYLAASFSNPTINYNHWAMFKKMFELQWMDHPLALAGNLIYVIGNSLLGLGGLIILRRTRMLSHLRAENSGLKRAGKPLDPDV